MYSDAARKQQFYDTGKKAQFPEAEEKAEFSDTGEGGPEFSDIGKEVHPVCSECIAFGDERVTCVKQMRRVFICDKKRSRERERGKQARLLDPTSRSIHLRNVESKISTLRRFELVARVLLPKLSVSRMKSWRKYSARVNCAETFNGAVSNFWLLVNRQSERERAIARTCFRIRRLRRFRISIVAEIAGLVHFVQK